MPTCTECVYLLLYAAPGREPRARPRGMPYVMPSLLDRLVRMETGPWSWHSASRGIDRHVERVGPFASGIGRKAS